MKLQYNDYMALKSIPNKFKTISVTGYISQAKIQDLENSGLVISRPNSTDREFKWYSNILYTHLEYRITLKGIWALYRYDKEFGIKFDEKYKIVYYDRP